MLAGCLRLHTHTLECVILITIPWQQQFRERVSVLHVYTYIAWLVITKTECVYCEIRTEFVNIIEVNLYP